MFESRHHGGANLMFTDATKMLKDVSEVDGGSRQTYFDWVGEYNEGANTTYEG